MLAWFRSDKFPRQPSVAVVKTNIKLLSPLFSSILVKLNSFKFIEANQFDCLSWICRYHGLALFQWNNGGGGPARTVLLKWNTMYPYLLLNWPTTATFVFIFGLFKQTSNNNFYNKSTWKNFISIQYMVSGLEPTTSRSWVISHNH